MKAIILSGDSGSRLHPLTLAIPKQLLPIYDKPMVYYPIEMLVKVGIIDILIITSEENQTLFKRALGDGSQFGATLSYACQKAPEGVAQAITIGRNFIGNDHVILITGDTIIVGKSFAAQLQKAIKAAEKSANATVFATIDNDENQYGKVITNRQGKVEDIVGKSSGSLDLAIAGVYVFPNVVVECVKQIQPSERNRFEITDVNRIFNDRNKLQLQRINRDCQWLDTNTFDNLLRCAQIIQKQTKTEI